MKKKNIVVAQFASNKYFFHFNLFINILFGVVIDLAKNGEILENSSLKKSILFYLVKLYSWNTLYEDLVN